MDSVEDQLAKPSLSSLAELSLGLAQLQLVITDQYLSDEIAAYGTVGIVLLKFTLLS